MKNEKKSSNPLVAGAVLAGIAVTAAVLSKKENRDKAAQLVKDAVKKGEKFMKNPEVVKTTAVVAAKVLEDVKTNVEKKVAPLQNSHRETKKS